jgi:hypothetical protein
MTLYCAVRRVLRADRRSVIREPPLWSERDTDRQTAQNFVDIMVKIHNKIQNIKSPRFNRGVFYPLLRKSRQKDCFRSWVSQGR